MDITDHGRDLRDESGHGVLLSSLTFKGADPFLKGEHSSILVPIT